MYFMKHLSVNINKIATLRNARGGNVPDIIKAAIDIECFGADGITVHPRPDQRHIRFDDVYKLKKVVTTEFNVEGYPSPEFINMVLEIVPHQVTLVPDPPEAITSNNGWDVPANMSFLEEIIQKLKLAGIRTSIFLNPDVQMVRAAKLTGTDRIELYTESYAVEFPENPQNAILPFQKAAEEAHRQGLGVNAGHDLSKENLNFFSRHIPGLLEVSIGHALISDALYMGLENTVQIYKRELNKI
jgi:pyridoxine 5-phosphate synthase